MKFLSQLKTQNWTALTLMLVVVTMLFPMSLFAADTSGIVQTLKSDGVFKKAIDAGLIIWAIWLWFDYFSSFDPSSAFKSAIKPAFITFLAFQWAQVLGWFI
jgi:hypothetical protein